MLRARIVEIVKKSAVVAGVTGALLLPIGAAATAAAPAGSGHPVAVADAATTSGVASAPVVADMGWQ
ncbi:hypothetical protein CFP65_3641 [Kitasatospora sp. MMS16-BH015]|uniref:hypothetical protein n=1 Tax=Kitasatospora sp. MMS16-BH015 TaxID=2018025 RepID=UPI000CA16B31|nr:hypothetical protein [Kitasatospora sp. MMS16-BH015]AUG78430.1 hypothetical protein CFP65_3641 [Kitasatospora sp. MMS16-BH015]